MQASREKIEGLHTHYLNSEESKSRKIFRLKTNSIVQCVVQNCSKVPSKSIEAYPSKVISESESAFILDRIITDNIMLAFEMSHYIKRKRLGKRGWWR